MRTFVRVPCAVPFCPRWCRGVPGRATDWICWPHWKAIPLARRKAYFRAVAERMPRWLRERGHIPRWMTPRPSRASAPRDVEAVFRLWRRMRADAIARAL